MAITTKKTHNILALSFNCNEDTGSNCFLCWVRFNLNLAFSGLRDHERHLAAFTSVFWWHVSHITTISTLHLLHSEPLMTLPLSPAAALSQWLVYILISHVFFVLHHHVFYNDPSYITSAKQKIACLEVLSQKDAFYSWHCFQSGGFLYSPDLWKAQTFEPLLCRSHTDNTWGLLRSYMSHSVTWESSESQDSRYSLLVK